MTVAELIEELRKLPQNKLVEIFIPHEDPEDPDEQPATNFNLYADIHSVYAKGDVVTIQG